LRLSACELIHYGQRRSLTRSGGESVERSWLTGWRNYSTLPSPWIFKHERRAMTKSYDGWDKLKCNSCGGDTFHMTKAEFVECCKCGRCRHIDGINTFEDPDPEQIGDRMGLL
jgi:hypothetical protein